TNVQSCPTLKPNKYPAMPPATRCPETTAATTLTAAPSTNARNNANGDVNPPPTERINHCAPITAVNVAPMTASGNGASRINIMKPPMAQKTSSVKASALRIGAAMASTRWSYNLSDAKRETMTWIGAHKITVVA